MNSFWNSGSFGSAAIGLGVVHCSVILTKQKFLMLKRVHKSYIA